MTGIFCTKVAAEVALAQQPALAQSPVFGWASSVLYGTLSNFFVGRAARVW
jgi:hypothetical protein